MEISAIGTEYAADVARIEKEMHDPRLVQGETRLRNFLQRAEASGNSQCFGLFHKGELGGYLLCGDLRPSFFPQFKGEQVIYIYDISVLPKYRRLSFRLLTKWWESARTCFPRAAIEMHIIEEGKQLWLSHSSMLTRFGMEFQACDYLNREYKGQRRYRMRFNQIDSNRHKDFDLAGHIAALPIIEENNGQQLRLLDDPNAWPHYQQALQTLYQQCPNKSPALDYAFQRSCWLSKPRGHQLQYLLLFRDDHLLAAAPLYTHYNKGLFKQSAEQRMITPGFAAATLNNGISYPVLEKQLPQSASELRQSSAPINLPKPQFSYDSELLPSGPEQENAVNDLTLLHCCAPEDNNSLQAMQGFVQHAAFDADYCNNFNIDLLILRVHRQAFAAAYILHNEDQAWIAASGRNIGNGYGNSQRLAANLALTKFAHKNCRFITTQ